MLQVHSTIGQVWVIRGYDLEEVDQNSIQTIMQKLVKKK